MQVSREQFDRARSGDRQARDAIFDANMGLVWACVRRFRGLMETDDLFQLGAIGLLKAIERFDPDMGVSFSTLAVPYILGEIKRHLRDGTPIRVARRLKEIALAAQKYIRDELARTGKEPPVDQVAGHLGIETDLLIQALEAASPVVHLAGTYVAGRQRQDAPCDEEEQVTIRADLETAMEKLEPEVKHIIQGRYLCGKTQEELARELGISQAHVCRLERRGLMAMRAYLGALHPASSETSDYP